MLSPRHDSDESRLARPRVLPRYTPEAEEACTRCPDDRWRLGCFCLCPNCCCCCCCYSLLLPSLALQRDSHKNGADAAALMLDRTGQAGRVVDSLALVVSSGGRQPWTRCAAMQLDTEKHVRRVRAPKERFPRLETHSTERERLSDELDAVGLQ